MIRLRDVKLPLDHDEEALESAVLKKLRVGKGDLGEIAIFKRSYDARKKSAILLVYTVDVGLKSAAFEKKLIKRFAKDQRVSVTPDMRYAFAAKAPEQGVSESERPIIIGSGPCGIFAGLTLAQMGFRPSLFLARRTLHFHKWLENIV